MKYDYNNISKLTKKDIEKTESIINFLFKWFAVGSSIALFILLCFAVRYLVNSLGHT